MPSKDLKHMEPRLKGYAPDRNGPCPCGAVIDEPVKPGKQPRRKKYKNCCQPEERQAEIDARRARRQSTEDHTDDVVAVPV